VAACWLLLLRQPVRTKKFSPVFNPKFLLLFLP
jgi:hypothetical protein